LSIVLDASMTLAWLFEDEQTDQVLATINHVYMGGASVPPLWRYEVANGLQMAIRRQRITPDYRTRCLDKIDELPITIDPDGVSEIWSTTIKLADLYRLTVYDAAYLELAQRRRLPLATLDAALSKAARESGVDLFF
jgi:predicted nucleic acid-binding protein